MFRSGASRSILRSLNNTTPTTLRAAPRQQLRSQLCTVARRPQTLANVKPLVPKSLALARWQSRDERPTVNKIDRDREASIAQKSIKATPETVSATSTVISPTDPAPAHEEDEPQMLAGIKSDLQTIRETFSLEEVPRQAYYMGLAGVLPYAATAMTTVFCAAEINHAAEHGTGWMLSGQSAEALLHIVEPLQVGYGAVILSFLGAIHWGLEWASYGGSKGYPRYMIGVISTAVAWPTILMPVEYALITQFLAFNFLYYTDARAKRRGWTPPWYGVYRFVLTFVVGTSIVISLIGRGQIADRIGKPAGVADRIRALRGDQGEAVMEEEEARRRFLSEGEEEEEEDDDE